MTSILVFIFDTILFQNNIYCKLVSKLTSKQLYTLLLEIYLNFLNMMSNEDEQSQSNEGELISSLGKLC